MSTEPNYPVSISIGTVLSRQKGAIWVKWLIEQTPVLAQKEQRREESRQAALGLRWPKTEALLSAIRLLNKATT